MKIIKNIANSSLQHLESLTKQASLACESGVKDVNASALKKDVVDFLAKKGFCNRFWSRISKCRYFANNDGNKTIVTYQPLLNSFNAMLNNTGVAELKEPLGFGIEKNYGSNRVNRCRI